MYLLVLPMLKLDGKSGKSTDTACYTSNLTPTLQLFYDLIELKEGNVTASQSLYSG